MVLSFSSQAAAQGVNLSVNIADPHQELTADYDRLVQVISNLISNALRHTPEGGNISIETGLGSSAESTPQAPSVARNVQILVKDSGEGIAAEDLPFIFDRFWRADKSRSERAHSGLGLAITKQLVHAHKGTVEVRSAPGIGSTFIVDLPENLQSF